MSEPDQYYPFAMSAVKVLDRNEAPDGEFES